MQPKLYFNLDSVLMVLKPINSYPELTQAKNNGWSKKQHTLYNQFTKDWIKDHLNCKDFICSTDYDFDPNGQYFNFYDLQVCGDDDYFEIMNQSHCPIDINTPIASPKGVFVAKTTQAIGTTLLDTIKAQNPCPSIESGFYFDPKRWNLLVRNIKRKVNTMLIGPTGTGKTDIIIRICQELGIDCHIYDMGAMQDPLTDLLGSHRLENGSSKFDYAKFVYDVQKPGVILLDELSRAPFMTNNILFPCLDGRRTLPIEIADSESEREIKIHPDCVFIATANVGIEYSGTCDIDMALANRFMTVQVDYLPIEVETKILNVRTGINGDDASRIAEIAAIIRNSYLSGEVSKTISTRETINCAELVIDGFSLMEAVDFTFCDKFSKNKDNNENDKIKKLIMGF